ncbi:MAG TPA: UDP-N-acetylglucosamine 2-epimerase (non-hydrolyzing) [Sphingomicrobium sp.]|nr:UDP-N-acetylglucosamine 2-epimerase (non-hydrolyzing) [Sphingomicrobium sp.]
MRALDARGIAPLLIFSGQHPLLDPADHGLGGYAILRLACAGQDDPHAHVGAVSKAILEVLRAAPPELVIVQGDTSSALGGALAAKFAAIPLAHVEAGLRSHDLRRPWPEEEFRVAIDGDAELLFAPTELSAANLRRERVRGQIHVTGNSGIDAVIVARQEVATPVRDGGIPRLLVTCHRRENWDDGLDGVAAALRAIASNGLARAEVILHPNPSLARRVRDMLSGQFNIAFRPPCGHSDTVSAMLGADLVLSDSGGIQEEATALGIPLLVLRDKTERPEAIACGNIELVGTDPGRIVAAVRRRLDRCGAAAPTLPFGDGRAGERIAAIIAEWLTERAEGVPTPSPMPSSWPRQLENW